MKIKKINYFSINFTDKECAALWTAKDAVAELIEACDGAELIKSELDEVIKVSELPRVVEILDTLIRSICYKVD